MPDLTGLGTAVTGVKDILGMFFPDQTELDKSKMAAALALQLDQNKLIELQAQANANEALQPGLHFRDGAGWVCVIGLGVSVLKPLIEWGSHLIGSPIVLPPVDTSTTSTMLYALLGLGSLHAAPAIMDSVRSK